MCCAAGTAVWSEGHALSLAACREQNLSVHFKSPRRTTSVLHEGNTALKMHLSSNILQQRLELKVVSAIFLFFFRSKHKLLHSSDISSRSASCPPHKSERLTNGAATSYEWLRKVPPLLEDFLSPCKSPCKSPEGRILSPNHTHKTS